jgi:hypothetical protein
MGRAGSFLREIVVAPTITGPLRIGAAGTMVSDPPTHERKRAANPTLASET